MKIESKTGKVPHSDQKIFNFISDFNNIKQLVPADKVFNWQSTKEECSFEVSGLGKTGMKIIETESCKLVKISSIDSSPIQFFIWIQLKKADENNTRVKITIEPNVNLMMMTFVKVPLQEFVDKLVDRMATFNF
jgi:carbon monoxide dehydrogenase subunit G